MRTVFKITPDGTQTMLYGFCSQTNCTDGLNPQAPLAQAANGDFYGTAYLGGAYGAGTIFKITPSGTLTTVYSFCSQNGCMDGSGPLAGLVQARNEDCYGTTYSGGANSYGTLKPGWHADDAVELLLPTELHGRRKPRGGLNPGRQRRPLWDNVRWRGQRQLWDDLPKLRRVAS
jgi:uncharacterized repeat protein (TIGR03803 family)